MTWGPWAWAFEWRKLICERLRELVDDLLMQSSCRLWVELRGPFAAVNRMDYEGDGGLPVERTRSCMLRGTMGKVDSREHCKRTWFGSTNEPLALFGHGAHWLAPVDAHDRFVSDRLVEDLLLCRHNEIASGRLNLNLLLLEEWHTENNFRMVEQGNEKRNGLP